jgi:hypothetical protein
MLNELCLSYRHEVIIKEMFYISIKLKPELARASMTTSDVFLRIECILFVVLFACKSVDRSTIVVLRSTLLHANKLRSTLLHANKTIKKAFHIIDDRLMLNELCLSYRHEVIIKEMFYISIKLKPELARASMTTSDVNNQWRSNFQQQII